MPWTGSPLNLAAFNNLLSQQVGDITPTDLNSLRDFLARRLHNQAETLSTISAKFAQ